MNSEDDAEICGHATRASVQPLRVGDTIHELAQVGLGDSASGAALEVRSLTVVGIDRDRVRLRATNGSERTSSTREPRRVYLSEGAAAVARLAIIAQDEARVELAAARLGRGPHDRAAIRRLSDSIAAADNALGTLGRPLEDFVVGHQVMDPRTSPDLELAAALAAGESERLELKASLCWAARAATTGIPRDEGERVAARTVAAFANALGGDLFVGIDDSGVALGVASDFTALPSLGKYQANRDGWQLRLRSKLDQYLGALASALTTVTWLGGDEAPVARVAVRQSDVPVFFRDNDRVDFYVRTGNESRRLSIDEAIEYARGRFYATGRDARGRNR